MPKDISSFFSRRGQGGANRGRGRGRGGGGGASGSYQARRENYSSIARENEEVHIPQLLRDLPELQAAVAKSVSYSSMPPATPATPLEGGRRTKFGFVNADSFTAAEVLVEKWGGDKVAVLNMANAYKPGGGYLNGASAQEEALCRRSTLYAHIAKRSFYPHHEEGGLWSEGIRVFRKGDDDFCEVLPAEEHYTLGVVSVAAIDGPQLNREGTEYGDVEEAQLMLRKIQAILRIAKLHQQRALVLGAFGCGAFHNPPPAVANLFLRALTQTSEFLNVFEAVQFAILERSGSDNMRPWKKVWKSVVEAQDEMGVSGDDVEAEAASKETDGASTPRKAAVSKELEVLDLTEDTSPTGGRSTAAFGQSNPSGTALEGEASGRSAAEWKAAFEKSDAAAEAYKKGL